MGLSMHKVVRFKLKYATWVPMDANTYIVLWLSMSSMKVFWFSPWHKIACNIRFQSNKYITNTVFELDEACVNCIRYMVVHWDPTSFKVKVDVYKIPRLHISISWILFWARFQWICKHCMKLEFESSNNSTYPNGQYFPKYIVYNTKLTFFYFLLFPKDSRDLNQCRVDTWQKGRGKHKLLLK